MNDMRMVDVKYDEYALTHTIKTKGGVPTAVNKLYGKVLVSNAALCPMNIIYSYSHAYCSRLISCGSTGRAEDLSADLLEKFRQFSLDTGILPENIAFLPKNGTFYINEEVLFFKKQQQSVIKSDVMHSSLFSFLPL